MPAGPAPAERGIGATPDARARPSGRLCDSGRLSQAPTSGAPQSPRARARAALGEPTVSPQSALPRDPRAWAREVLPRARPGATQREWEHARAAAPHMSLLLCVGPNLPTPAYGAILAGWELDEVVLLDAGADRAEREAARQLLRASIATTRAPTLHWAELDDGAPWSSAHIERWAAAAAAKGHVVAVHAALRHGADDEAALAAATAVRLGAPHALVAADAPDAAIAGGSSSANAAAAHHASALRCFGTSVAWDDGALGYSRGTRRTYASFPVSAPAHLGHAARAVAALTPPGWRAGDPGADGRYPGRTRAWGTNRHVTRAPRRGLWRTATDEPRFPPLNAAMALAGLHLTAAPLSTLDEGTMRAALGGAPCGQRSTWIWSCALSQYAAPVDASDDEERPQAAAQVTPQAGPLRRPLGQRIAQAHVESAHSAAPAAPHGGGAVDAELLAPQAPPRPALVRAATPPPPSRQWVFRDLADFARGSSFAPTKILASSDVLAPDGVRTIVGQKVFIQGSPHTGSPTLAAMLEATCRDFNTKGTLLLPCVEGIVRRIADRDRCGNVRCLRRYPRGARIFARHGSNGTTYPPTTCDWVVLRVGGSCEMGEQYTRSLTLLTDGATRDNGTPHAQSAGACVIGDPSSGEMVAQCARRYTRDEAATNNAAEFQALLDGIRRCKALAAHATDGRGRLAAIRAKVDSQLLVKQYHGEYDVKDEKLRELILAIRLETNSLAAFSLSHIPRERNAAADRLANRALDELASPGGPPIIEGREGWKTSAAEQARQAPHEQARRARRLAEEAQQAQRRQQASAATRPEPAEHVQAKAAAAAYQGSYDPRVDDGIDVEAVADGAATEWTEQQRTACAATARELLQQADLLTQGAATALEAWRSSGRPPDLPRAPDWFKGRGPEQLGGRLEPAFFERLKPILGEHDEALKEALHMAREGVHIDFGAPPPEGKRERNAASCARPEYRAKLAENLEFYEQSTITEYFSGLTTRDQFAAAINPCIVVVRFEGDPKPRFCVDLTRLGVNAALTPRPFQMPRVVDLLPGLRPGHWLWKSDLAKAFYQHARVEPESRRWMAFIDPRDGRLARFTVAPFGLASAPSYLHVVVQTLVRAVKSVAARGSAAVQEAARWLEAYADDVYSTGEPEALGVVAALCIAVMHAGGLAFDPGKTEVGAELDILGAEAICDDETIGLAPARAVKYSAHLEAAVASDAGIEMQQWSELTGRLIYASTFADPPVPADVREAMLDAQAGARRSGRARVPPSVAAWWRSALAAPREQLRLHRAPNPEPATAHRAWAPGPTPPPERVDAFEVPHGNGQRIGEASHPGPAPPKCPLCRSTDFGRWGAPPVCSGCKRAFHPACIEVSPDIMVAHWRCPLCDDMYQGPEDMGQQQLTPELRAMVAQAAAISQFRLAESTHRTYWQHLHSFIFYARRAAASVGTTLPLRDVCPPGREPIPLYAYMLFLENARDDLSNSYMAQTLSGVAAWIADKSGGEAPNHSVHPIVTGVLAGAQRLNRGTKRAKVEPRTACPTHVLVALRRAAIGLATAAQLRAAAFAARGHHRAAKYAYLEAYGYARDASFMVLAFTAALRKSEAVALEWEDIRNAEGVPGFWDIGIRKSKVDQRWTGQWVMVNKDGGELQVEQTLGHMRELAHAAGISTAPEAALFTDCRPGSDNDRQLASGDAVIRRLHALYIPIARARGVHFPDDALFAGHSFRRGGINALRDHGRECGWDDSTILRVLLEHGRWKCTSSVLLYLEHDRRLQAEFARHFGTQPPPPGAPAPAASSPEGIQLGRTDADNEDQCRGCGRDGHSRQLVMCDAAGCAASWCLRCLQVRSASGLPDPWRCPACSGRSSPR